MRASLKWQSELDAGELAATLGLDEAEVEGALAVLGTRGLAGFDASTQRYFHRELPFDLDKVEEMQPRLGNARKLLEEGKVRRVGGGVPPASIFEVGHGYRPSRAARGRAADCTCPWFSKYQGQRGPCKHILAASLLLQDEGEGGAGR